MNCNICFVNNSFNFQQTTKHIAEALGNASSLVNKMSSDFVQFSKSSDFDEHAALAITSRSPDEIGYLFSVVYDGNIGSAAILELDSLELTNIVDTEFPELNASWLGLYSNVDQGVLTKTEEKTIHYESCLVSYCSNILVKNSRGHDEYASGFKDIYKNLIFRTDVTEKVLAFNRLNKVDGGYVNFIENITTCLSFLNHYDVILDDSLKNIELINAGLEVPVTPEGKGKGQRAGNELKRDFYINNTKYESINCEFHCKLGYPDGSSMTGKPKPNRIYFGFITHEKDNPQIAVAHIGEHW